MVHTKVVFEEGWSFIRGRKQCKPKHVSSGVVVLNVRWSFDQGGLSRGGLLYNNIDNNNKNNNINYVLKSF